MVYRNKNTGAIVEFSSELSGGPWEPIESPRPAKASDPKPAAKAPKKTAPKK